MGVGVGAGADVGDRAGAGAGELILELKLRPEELAPELDLVPRLVPEPVTELVPKLTARAGTIIGAGDRAGTGPGTRIDTIRVDFGARVCRC